MSIIDKATINFINSGETTNQEVLNRHVDNLIDQLNLAGKTKILADTNTLDTLQVNEVNSTINLNIPSATSVDANTFVLIFVPADAGEISPVFTADGTDELFIDESGTGVSNFTYDAGYGSKFYLVSNGTDSWRVVKGGGAGGGAGGTGSSSVVTDGDTLQAGVSFIPDNSAGPCSYTMPATPEEGDTISWRASPTLFSTNSMTINVADKNIMGDATSLVVDVDYFGGSLVFNVEDDEWKLYSDNQLGSI